jgi:hypothetical protein
MRALRTRSLLSRTAASGRPTILRQEAVRLVHFDGDSESVDARLSPAVDLCQQGLFTLPFLFLSGQRRFQLGETL